VGTAIGGYQGVDFISRPILAFIRLFLGALLIASVILICANATGRYVFLAPIIWAEEILGYVLVWTVYLGSVLVTWDGGHLKMDLLSRTLPSAPRAIVNGFSTVVFIGIGTLIVYQSWFAIQGFTHVSQIAEVPMNLMHAIIPVSFVLIALFIVIRFRGYLSGTLESDEEQMEALKETAAAAEGSITKQDGD
jgi:TRAP-type C4-dicarboxylate transport system permease small subunit